MPDLPKYKLDSNRQIVIDELEKEEEDSSDKNAVIDEIKEVNTINNELQNEAEAPEPQEGEEDNT